MCPVWRPVTASNRPAHTAALEESGTDPNRLPSVLKSAQAYIESLQSRSAAAATLGELIERVQLSRASLHLSLKLPLTELSDAASPVSLVLSRLVPMQMKRRGVEMRIVVEGDTTPNQVDRPLLKAVARGRKWSQDLLAGRVQSVHEIAIREKVADRYVRELLPLGFLAPTIKLSDIDIESRL